MNGDTSKCIHIWSSVKDLLKKVKKKYSKKKGAYLPYSFIIKESLEALIEKEKLDIERDKDFDQKS